MKKIIFLLLLLPNLLFSGIGDVYYCNDIYSRGVAIEDGKGVEKNYISEKFSFKRNSDSIIFNKNADNSFSNFVLDKVHNYYTNDWFEAYDKEVETNAIFKYQDGKYLYVDNFANSSATLRYGTCEIF